MLSGEVANNKYFTVFGLTWPARTHDRRPHSRWAC